MRSRLARQFRDESLATTVPAGFLVLYAVWLLVASIVTGIVYPLILRVLDRDPYNGSGNVDDVTSLVIYGATYLLLLLVVYLLLTRWLDAGDAVDTRECPECKSDIFADARRCAFCSAAVTPLVELSASVEETDGG
jgi:hypothetical protein